MEDSENMTVGVLKAKRAIWLKYFQVREPVITLDILSHFWIPVKKIPVKKHFNT